MTDELSDLGWAVELVAKAMLTDTGNRERRRGAAGSSPAFTLQRSRRRHLCGSMFGLNDGTSELRRHRLFESNVPMEQLPCRHHLPVIGFYGDHARTRQRTIAGNRNRGGDIVGTERKLALVRDLMGIDWMRWPEACQAIPPAYTEWIGARLLESLRAAA